MIQMFLKQRVVDKIPEQWKYEILSSIASIVVENPFDIVKDSGVLSLQYIL